MLKSIGVQGLARVTPKNRITTQEIVEALGPDRISEKMAKTLLSLGVSSRYTLVDNFLEFFEKGAVAQFEKTVTDLCQEAAVKVVEQNDINWNEIGLFVGITNSPARLLPSLAAEVAARLHGRLSSSTNVYAAQAQGCSALIKTFEVVSWYLRQNKNKKVLVVVGEAHTPMNSFYKLPKDRPVLHYSEYDRGSQDFAKNLRAAEIVIQGALFGDAAVGMVLTSAEQALSMSCRYSHLTNFDPSDVELLTLAEGGSASPRIDGHPQYRMHPSVPERGAQYALNTINELLRGDTIDSYERILIHTGSKKILDGICEVIGVDKQSDKVKTSYDILAKYGNVSSASIGLMLSELPPEPGKILLSSFGVGFGASGTVGEMKAVSGRGALKITGQSLDKRIRLSS